MSKLSIYENSWLDLVFEGRNKEYGAYQLRQQNPKTTLKALFFGTLICGSLLSIPVISGLLKDENSVAVNDGPSEPITFVEFLPEKPIIEPEKSTEKVEVEKSSAKQKVLINPKVTDNSTTTREITPLNPEIPEKTGNTENLGDNAGAIALGESAIDGKGKTPVYETPVINTGGGTEILPNVGLEKSPEFPGGIKNFLETVGKKFRTPEDMETSGKMMVFVYFVVEKDGSLSNMKVIRDPGYGLGNEAIRVLKSIKTKWSPGIQNNKPVRTAFNLPISVKIN